MLFWLDTIDNPFERFERFHVDVLLDRFKQSLCWSHVCSWFVVCAFPLTMGW